MSSIHAQPYDFSFDRNKLALVIIDMQRDFCEPGGFGEALGNNVAPLVKIIPTVKQLLDAFRKFGLPVVHTKEGHRPDLSDCPPSKVSRGKGTLKIGESGPMGRVLILGEPGNDFVDALKPMPGEVVLSKPGKGAFYATDLDRVLRERGITHLLLTGVTTEVCVQTTMREANDRGYECLLVEDATESYFPQFKASALEMIRAQGGIVGWTAPCAAVIEGLESSAATSAPVSQIPAPPALTPIILRQILSAPNRLADLDWKPFRQGIEIVPFYAAKEGGSSAALLKYSAGSNVPCHTHTGYEHVLILAGSQTDERNTYHAGDMLISPPGTSHSISSKEGCVVFAVWERPVMFK